MALNMKKAMAFLKKDLSKNWGKLDFEYTFEENGIKAVASDITLNGFDDNIMLIIRGYEGGGFVCRAVFDKIDKTPHALDLLNTFNDNSAFFKAFIREDGYLELYHFFVCYDVKVYKEYGSEFLCRAADLNKDDTMVELASLTKQSE